MAFSSTNGTQEYNIETFAGKNLVLRSNVLKADGKASNYMDPAAQFYVDEGVISVNSNDLLYRFRPVTQPNKYLGVSGTNIVLKDVPNTTVPTDSSHDFVLRSDQSYKMFLYRYSPVNVPLFMSTDNNDDVVLARDSDKALFQLRPVLGTTTSNAVAQSNPLDYLPEFDTAFIEIEEDLFHGKIIVTERISVSEE